MHHIYYYLCVVLVVSSCGTLGHAPLIQYFMGVWNMFITQELKYASSHYNFIYCFSRMAIGVKDSLKYCH